MKEKLKSLYLLTANTRISISRIIDFIKLSRKEQMICLFSLALFAFIINRYFSNINLNESFTTLGYDSYFNVISGRYSIPYIQHWNIRHPLLNLIISPLHLVAMMLEQIGINPFYTLTCLSALVVTVSLIIVFRICHDLLRLNTVESYLITFMFLSFGHVMILSFQVDSFTYTMFFMLLFFYYLIKGRITTTGNNIFFMFITGITSTNSLKVLASLFIYYIHGNKFTKAIYNTFKSIFLFIILFAICIIDLCKRLFTEKMDISTAIMEDTMKYTHETSANMFNYINSLTDPVLLQATDLIQKDDRVIMGGYHSFSSYIIIALFIIYFIYMLTATRRSFIVKCIMSSLCVDIIINVIMGYGIAEGHLFAIHWLVYIPVVTAVFIKGIRSRLFLRINLIMILLFASYFSLGNFMTIRSGLKVRYRNSFELQAKELSNRFISVAPSDNPTNIFYFGMGDRPKLYYRNGVLHNIFTGDTLINVKPISDIISHDKYTVDITADDVSYRIEETENGIYINGKLLEGSDTHVNLPDFAGYRYDRILRVLHHEILWNIKEGKIYPNIMAYDKPWYRDAMMALMCLKETGNVDLVKDWILSLDDVYDYQNDNNAEPDNLGEAYYIASFYPDETVAFRRKILLEAERIRKERGDNKFYIDGPVDYQNQASYPTLLLSFAIGDEPEEYDPANLPGAYYDLVWYGDQRRDITFDKLKETMSNSYFQKSFDYPYLEWARANYYRNHLIPFKGTYPLSWESNASMADYTLPNKVNERVNKTVEPHIWAASEMFLYIYKMK